MSAGDQAAVAIVAHLALAADGAVIGVALAYVAIRSLVKYAATSSALRKITDAPSVHVSDLRSVLATADDGDGGVGGGGERIVIMRGTVESKSAVIGSWSSFLPHVLVSHDSGDRAVVIQRSQKYIYNEWRGLFGWYPDLRAILARSWRDQGSASTRTVPFVLVDSQQQPLSDYVVVDLDGSRHPLPLTTVYRQMQPIQASPYTFLPALFGHEYPVGVVDEEKVLPVGVDVTAVGVCSSKDGAPLIKPCKDLPYFLNWNKWKQWREQRRVQQQRASEVANSIEDPEVVEDDESDGDIPDGQLCVICLMRR